MKDRPKIKLSKRSQKRIKDAVSQAFYDLTSEYECYDPLPNKWMVYESELWNALQEFKTRVLADLEEIMKDK